MPDDKPADRNTEKQKSNLESRIAKLTEAFMDLTDKWPILLVRDRGEYAELWSFCLVQLRDLREKVNKGEISEAELQEDFGFVNGLFACAAFLACGNLTAAYNRIR